MNHHHHSSIPFPQFLISLILLSYFPFSTPQLTPMESRILFRIQELLEHPPPLQQWNNWTNFCILTPTPSLIITCQGNHITQLTIIGTQKTKKTLSPKFSIDSFFTILTKISNLETLSLTSLGLWGPLPQKINRFKSLKLLNLSFNSIHGEIPQSLSTCTSLKNLILNNNMFNGSVPKDWSNLRSLESVDISFNRLNGLIPFFLFSMPSMRYVNLGKNMFSGALPSNVSCNGNLGFVDISNNLLYGKLPSCFLGNRSVVIMWNCFANTSSKYQRPNSFCQRDALAVKVPQRERQESTLKIGVVLGVIGSVIAILGLLGLLVFVVLKRVQRGRGMGLKGDSFTFEKKPIHVAEMGKRAAPPMRMTSMSLPPYQVFTLEEMEDATNNFDPSNLVLEESHGQVYKGWLRDGSMVLVKCLKLKQKYSPQALQKHMEVVSRLRHRHLVSVLGHCIVSYHDHPSTGATVFVVVEHISNGSLRDHLSDWRKRELLKWPQRMNIAMGIAKGIQYLHNGGVLGNDLKIDNILMDDSLTAKITNYNINLPNKVGVESPLINGQDASVQSISEKEDIYKLGAILVEIITGRVVNSNIESDDLKFQLERSIAESPSKLLDMVDPSMRGSFAYESVKTVAHMAVNCLCKDPVGRPTAEDVVWHLQYSVQVQEGWGSSGNLSGNLGNKM